VYLDTTLNRLYIPNSGSNTVTVLDASNVNVANQPAIPTLGTPNVGSSPVSVTALRNGTKVYVANAVSNDVTVLSATSFATLKTVPVGTDPVWIASEPTSTKIYTANYAAGTISIIQTSNDTVSATVNAPQQNPTCMSSCALQQPVMILTF
jgi:YVTN family beta-propeller protein